MRSIGRVGVLVAGMISGVMFQSSLAQALIDGELLVGRRWYEFKADNVPAAGVQGQEITIGAHVDPIPLVPVAFGATYSMIDLRKGDLNGADGSVSEAALQIKAWIPMVPVAKPYARLRYPIMSRYEVTHTNYSANGKLTGPHLDVGARFDIFGPLSVNAELGLGMQKLEHDETKVNGVKQPAQKDTDANSTVFLLGVQVGI